jgi:hypothetical protein
MTITSPTRLTWLRWTWLHQACNDHLARLLFGRAVDTAWRTPLLRAFDNDDDDELTTRPAQAADTARVDAAPSRRRRRRRPRPPPVRARRRHGSGAGGYCSITTTTTTTWSSPAPYSSTPPIWLVWTLLHRAFDLEFAASCSSTPPTIPSPNKGDECRRAATSKCLTTLCLLHAVGLIRH